MLVDIVPMVIGMLMLGAEALMGIELSGYASSLMPIDADPFEAKG